MVLGLVGLGGWVVCQQHPGQIEDEARFVCKCDIVNTGDVKLG